MKNTMWEMVIKEGKGGEEEKNEWMLHFTNETDENKRS